MKTKSEPRPNQTLPKTPVKVVVKTDKLVAAVNRLAAKANK